jgi:Cdc6-like AAA superfamily ATPase
MDNKPKHRKPKSTSKSPSHIKKPSKTIHKASPHHSTILRNSTPHTSSSPTPPSLSLDITEKLTNSTIYCRDNERKHITDFISNDKIKTIFISGQPGTGKTSLLLDIFASYTCSSSSSNTKQKTKLKHYIKVTMNCMSMTTTTDFYSNIFISLNNVKQYSQYKKHLSTDEQYTQLINALDTNEPSRIALFQVLSILYSNNIGMFILLDEIDYLYRKNDEIVFYDVLNIPYISDNKYIKMFLISNNSDFDNEIFPKLKNRKINIEKIVFKPYTHIELYTIMKNKLEEIGMKDVFANDALRFLATKMNKNGDIRPVIEVIKGLLLDNNNNNTKQNKVIELRDMFVILKQKNTNLNEMLKAMTTEQKMIVAGMYFAMKSKNVNELEEKVIYDKYKHIKQQSNSPELYVEEFREVLKSFCDIGLIEPKQIKKGKQRSKSINAIIMYKIKYTVQDLEILFADEVMYALFHKEDDGGGETETETTK